MASYDFVSTVPDECRCSVTGEVLLEPHLTLCCGAHISKQVAEQYKAENLSCPNCSDPTISTVLDKSVQKKVLELKVRCPNSGGGCPWQGSLTEQDGHLMVCEHTSTECPYMCNEVLTRSTVKYHMENECLQRPTSCKYCSHRGSFSSLAQEHNAVCPGYPVTCPNGCGKDRIERRLLASHVMDCPMSAIPCNFSAVGCATKLPKGRMQQHIDTSVAHHLSLVAGKQTEMLSEIDSLKKMSRGNSFTDGPSRTERELSEMSSRLDKLEEKWSEHVEQQSQLLSSLQSGLSEQSEIIGNLEKKIHDQEKQKEVIAKLESQIAELQKIFAQTHDSIVVPEHPKAKKSPEPAEQPAAKKVSPDANPRVEHEHANQPKVTKNERKTSVPIQQAPKSSPPQQTREAAHTTAENSGSNNNQMVKSTTETEKPVPSEQGIRARMMMYENKSQSSERQSQPPPRNSFSQPATEKQDTPKVTAVAKPQAATSQMSKIKPTQIPPIDLVMTDFTERKENEDFWFSDPFYTHQGGYKLCLKVIPAGLGMGSGTHVSVSVYIMKGEFDDALKWPFKGDITLQLLDWAKEEVRCEKVISFTDKVDLDVSGRVIKDSRAEYGWGNPEFISHTDLASGRVKKIEYLRNDSLKFKVPKIVVYSK